MKCASIAVTIGNVGKGRPQLAAEKEHYLDLLFPCMAEHEDEDVRSYRTL